MLKKIQYSFSSTIFQNLVIFIASILLARNHGPYAMGLWSIITLIIGLLEVFSKHQFDIASTYFVGKKIFKFKEAFTICFIASFFFLVLTYLILLIFKSKLIIFFFQKEFELGKKIYYLAFISLPIIILYYNNLNHLITINKIKQHLHLQNFFCILTFLGVFIIYQFKLNLIYTFIFFFIIPGLICNFYFYIQYLHKTSFCRINKNLVLQYIKFSSKMYITNIIIISFFYVFRYYGVLSLNIETLAFLTIAISIANLFSQLIPSSLYSILYSKLSYSKNKSDETRYTLSFFKISIIFNFIFCLFFYFIIDNFIISLYGEKFKEVSNIFKNIILVFMMYNSSLPLNTYFNATGKSEINMYVFFFSFIISLIYLIFYNTALNEILISINVGFLLIFILRILFFIKISNCKLKSLFVFKDEFFLVKSEFENFLWKK